MHVFIWRDKEREREADVYTCFISQPPREVHIRKQKMRTKRPTSPNGNNITDDQRRRKDDKEINGQRCMKDGDG